jgi:hypothetical protein
MPRCHFIDCDAPVTHSVQRLWRLPNRQPFDLQYCCDQHVPGSFDADSHFIKTLRAGRGLSPFYRVERINHA